MQSPLRSRYETNLRQAVDRLRSLSEQDEAEVWGCTADVLAWLYRAEQVERKESGYYADRQSTASGRTLGGLLWFRGRVEHHGADVRVLDWRVSKTYLLGDDGVWKESQLLVLTEDGEWKPSEVRALGWAWPQVPTDARDDHRHGRDEWYRQYVEGKAVLLPVEAGANFLLSR